MEVLRNTRCANCNTRLDGPFCHNCGQREEPRVPTVRSILGEVINALFGLESKLWLSLWALLSKPGYLTQEFLAGKRQKYTTPFRLYLLLSIILFAYLAYASNQVSFDDVVVQQDQQQGKQVEEPKELAQDSETVPGQGSEQKRKTKKPKADINFDKMNVELGFLTDEQEQQVEAQLKVSAKKMQADINAGNISGVINHFLEPLPKMLLIFLPIMALLYRIIFLGRGKYYLEHLVFLLHNHAFLFALLILSYLLSHLSVLSRHLEAPLSLLLVITWLFYVPYYFYRSLRRVYKSSRFATVLYWLIIFITYLILLIIMLIFGAIFAGYTYS